MAINPLGSAGPATITGAGNTPKVGEGFGKVMKAQAQAPRLENAPQQIQNPKEAQSVSSAQAGKCRVESTNRADPSKQVTATKVLDQVNQAQNRMEQILKLAESGKSFSPAELLSLQTHVYRASQELDLAGKVVEKATGGVKQVLQTQV
ncbi:MAG: ATP-dependent helicase HrpB [Archangium sp.]|nr:ATP-dependent helicase HrpB [Archangium sp.]